MMSRVWKGLGLAAVLVLLVGILPASASAPSPPEPAPPSNTLRVYGNGAEDAPFPYTWWDEKAPFALGHDEAPPKDFVVWNPAYLKHTDTPFTLKIKVNGNDANQKVHLRQWYVPKLSEPLGVAAGVDPQSEPPAPHIVKEYTYILLDTDNNPVAGSPHNEAAWWSSETTALAFPIADEDPDQIGLDSYDANGDGTDDITIVADTNVQRGDWEYMAGVQFQTDVLAVPVGGEIQFLDHKVKITNVDTDHDEVALKVYYGGSEGADQPIPNGSSVQTLNEGDLLSAGRRNVNRDEQTHWIAEHTWDFLEPVNEPWYFYVENLVQDVAYVRVGRLLARGESFFVDGTEYAVSAIFTEEEIDGVWQASLNPDALFKYITIRNLLCKGDTATIDPITVVKSCIGPDEYIPFLPPFNMEHDIIDDVNLPTYEPCADDDGLDPDEQAWDNQVNEAETCGPTVAGAKFGVVSGIHAYFNTIAERRIQDQPPVLEYYIEEATEGRFTTNLMEEKFTEPGDLLPRFETGEELDFIDAYEFLADMPGWAADQMPAGYTILDWVGLWQADYEFCLPLPEYVTVYVNGTEVPVLVAFNYNGNGYVILDSSVTITPIAQLPTVTVTADYCALIPADGEYWEWINIDTNPDAYTEFVLPQVDDAPPAFLTDFAYGDYILVSSFTTEDDVRAKFAFDAQIGKVNSADVYVNDAAYNRDYYNVDANSLRLYGRGEAAAIDQASRPYASPQGPFDITSDEAPPKDFVVWNPAYMNHTQNDFFAQISVDEGDANEKVHLRQWYVPDLPEPLGEVWTGVTPVASDHIVKEYTYLLLDTDNNPVMAQEGISRFIFPLSDMDATQIGLDSYDYNFDGVPDLAELVDVYLNADGAPGVNLGTLMLEVKAGDELEFLDHRVEVIGVDNTPNVPGAGEVAVKLFYGGAMFGPDEGIGTRVIVEGEVLSAGRKDVLVPQAPAPVVRPWYMYVDSVIGDTAYVMVGRHLKEGESFFVDGAEYFVAKLFVGEGEDPGFEFGNGVFGAGDETLKYITIRNPLCKGGEVELEELTVLKECIAPMEMIPFLPPFNMRHDIIDDVEIPALQTAPDFQLWDNVVGESETFGPVIAGAQFGNDSLIHAFFNTIEERWVEGVPATMEYYIDETKEPRFDTNLLEEKFTLFEDGAEMWEWINIETMPWDYTEFVLPQIPDVAPAPAVGFVGDYIVVSSWMTQDGVRMKFSYDAADGTGIYVNRHGLECLGDFNNDGVVNMDDVWPLINRWNVAKGEAGYEALYDLNGDNIIDLADIMLVVGNWGPCS